MGKPCSPTTQLPSPGYGRRLFRTLSMDPSIRNSSCAGTRVSFIHFPYEDPPPRYEPTMCTFAILIKLPQLAACVITLWLHAEGEPLILDNRAPELLPYIIFSAYTIITFVIAFSYLLGQKMPEILIRMFSLIAVVTMLVCGAVVLNVCRIYWTAWSDCMDSGCEGLLPNMIAKRFHLLFSGVGAILASLLYAIDITYSLWKTVSLL